jgi:hypothetical protein
MAVSPTEVAADAASGVEFFRKRRRLAADSSFGICQEAGNSRVVGERLKSAGLSCVSLAPLIA